MTSWLVFAALTIASAPAPGPDTVSRAIHGRVFSGDSRLPVPYASVEAYAGTRRRTAVTDGEGRYVLKGIPPGEHRIHARALGHAPLEVTVRVPESGDVVLDLSLRIRPIGLPALTVVSIPGAGTADDAAVQPVTPGSPADPELRALEGSPGAAEMGLVEAARDARGDPLDPSSVLYVRGAASDLKFVLLDGAPVYAPFHLGGLLQAFPPGVLQSADLYVGGAPARYDGGLSYVLDLNTRQGRSDALHSSGALDLLAAAARVEGPLARAAYLAGGRIIHGAGTEPLTGHPLPYGYADALARVDLPLGERHRLSSTFFLNRESVRIENDSSALNGPARWGNTAGSLRYRGRLGESEAELTAAIGEFATRLPIGDTIPEVAHGRSLRARFAADFTRRAGPVTLGYGSSYDRHRIDVQTEAGNTSLTRLTRRREVDALGAYAEARWNPARELETRVGLRANLLPSAHDLRLAPRVSAAWHASEHSTLSAAAGRYHQFVHTSETILSSDLAEGWRSFAHPEDATERLSGVAGDSALPAVTGPLAVASATHLAVGLDHAPRQSLRLGVATFFKAFGGAPAVAGLRNAGVDLWVDWSEGAWAAWAGYSLAWVWTQEADSAETDRFSGRQLFSGGIRLPLPSGLRLNLRVATSSGLPFAAVPLRRSRNLADNVSGDSPLERRGEPFLGGAPDGAYLRIDVQVSRTLAARWLGLDFSFTPYLRVLNALDRRDALFYQFDARRDLRPRSLAAVPVLPVVGIEWSQ